MTEVDKLRQCDVEGVAAKIFGGLYGRASSVVISAGVGKTALLEARLAAGALYRKGVRVFMLPRPVPLAALPMYMRLSNSSAAAAVIDCGKSCVVIGRNGAVAKELRAKDCELNVDFYVEGVACGAILPAPRDDGEYIRGCLYGLIESEDGVYFDRSKRLSVPLKEGEYGALFKRISELTAYYSPMNGRAFSSLPHILTLMGFKEVIACKDDAFPSDQRYNDLSERGFLNVAKKIAESAEGDMLFVADPNGTSLAVGVKQEGVMTVLTDDELSERLLRLFESEKALADNIMSYKVQNGLKLRTKAVAVRDGAAAAVYAAIACI